MYIYCIIIHRCALCSFAVITCIADMLNSVSAHNAVVIMNYSRRCRSADKFPTKCLSNFFDILITNRKAPFCNLCIERPLPLLLSAFVQPPCRLCLLQLEMGPRCYKGVLFRSLQQYLMQMARSISWRV